jgi:glycosyltransferase involved in cell wall biosynthesis
MAKPHILVCAPFLTLPGEAGANRFVTLSKRLSKDFHVTLVTSRFSHSKKSHRKHLTQLGDVELVMLDEPGYKKNVGLRRVLSHRQFCRNLEKYLKRAPKFDLVYSAFPLVRTNLILGAKYKGTSVPLVIDVQDVWPEAIVGAIPMLSGRFGRFLMSGITSRANRVYGMADALVGVSHTYLRRADVAALPSDRKIVVYIGSDQLWFEGKPRLRDVSRPMKAVYLGTLGGSYDIETVVRAAALAPSIQVEIIGTGPFETQLKALNLALGGRAHFTGSLPYSDAMVRTANADVALNAIRTTALQSVTNKLSDYFCAGLPILSSQKNNEVDDLLSQGCGRTYEAGNPESLASLMLELSNSPEELRDMALSSRELARNLFMRPQTYEEIVALVSTLIAESE